MEEANGPLLNLTMEKGPLSGQTLQFKPGSSIHIGRVIRGNTITIKDPGISSKHLTMSFDSGSWVVTDLGSSNGTFLNTVLIDPTRPIKITDGDVVKIGELTSIKVKIVELAEGVEGKGKNARRNPRRKGGGCENVELGFGIGGDEGNVGVGVSSKRVTRSTMNEGVVSVDKVENFNEVEKGRKANRGRTTRGAKKVECVKNGEDGVEEVENIDVVDGEQEVKPCPRRTRGAKKVESVKNGDDGAEETENVDVEKERKPSPRRTRGAKKVESVKNGDDGVEEAENVDVRKPSPRRTRGCRKAENLKIGVGSEDVEKENRVCTRRTRGSRKEEDVEALDENVGECIEIKQRGKGKKGIARRVGSEEDEVMEKDQSDHEEAVENNADKGVERNMLDEVAMKSGRECCEASTSNACVNMGGVQIEEEVDLEKMTLGEWLDYLEVSLPKQIIDATEEMILAMNEKAERFQEFMKQQKDLKGCDAI